METYLRTKQLCDVTLVAGDRRIPAHRLVLSSVSDYFAAMFTSDVREAKQEEVKMEGVDPDALWVLVQYAYTGTHNYTPPLCQKKCTILFISHTLR
ncbi:unnamed protein product, partial [Oncorhynchus mykiss]